MSIDEDVQNSGAAEPAIVAPTVSSDANTSNPAIPTQMAGMVGGQSYASVRNAIFAPFIGKDDRPSLLVLLSDNPNICDDLATATLRANSREIVIEAFATDAKSGEPMDVEAATYTFYSTVNRANGPRSVFGVVSAYDGGCHSSLSAAEQRITEGTVTLTSLSDTTVQGHFSLGTYQRDDKIVGPIHATACANLAAYLTAPQPRTCVQ